MTFSDDCPARPGDILLGKYRVESVLGRGGMGVVVAARHLTLGERVAIKFLLPACVEQPQYVQRFLREARAAVRIRSQHVARVSDVGTMETGAPYMVMEYLEGQNLAAVLGARGPLPPGLAIELILQACEALAEAHAQGIVHRDVKPGNLFLTRHADGAPCVKVLDFGVSKVHDGQEHALTRTGAVLGSPLYMSPEQLRSARDVDARADVYSIGVVLYELLTGRVPFLAEDLPQLVYRIMNEAPAPLRSLRPELPEGLQVAVLRAMAHDAAARFFSVADLAVALAPYAPSSARGSVERICGVLRERDPRLARALEDGERVTGESTPWLSSGVPTAAMDPAALPAGTPTIAPFGATQAPPRRRSRWRGSLLAGVGLVALGGATLAWRRADRALSAAAVPVPPAVDAEPVPAPVSSEPPVAPSASAALAPDAAAAASSAPPRRSAPSPASPAPKRPPLKSDPFNRGVF